MTLTGDRVKILARSDKTFCYEVAEREKAEYTPEKCDQCDLVATHRDVRAHKEEAHK